MIDDQARNAVASRVAGVVASLDLAEPLSVQDGSGGTMRRRRGFAAQDYSGLASLALVDEEGTMGWVYQPPARGPASRRARRAATRTIGADVLYEFSFRETPANDVINALEKLDKKLTPNQGLRIYRDGKFEPAGGVAVKGKVLLLVHGTFSKSDMFIDELTSITTGKQLLARLAKEYEAILAFDHPTLSVSPWINALDLEAELARVTGPIDVVCHSRGGLVIAWWLRNALRQVGSVVFVGTPLEGTSLASPSSLRSALQGLANVFKGLEMAGALASTIVPFISVLTGLSKILGGALQLGASTPVADAAIAIVPGLVGQSRAGNNAELIRLTRAPWITRPKVHAIVSNFEPSESDAQWWQVWKLLRNPRERVLNWSADAIFNDKNDLVVDTQSMTMLCGTAIAKGGICDFGDSPTVHHCNYFRQDKSVAFLSKVLKV
jgi:pimeloyl-ACP methyl ester carboxylesterase